MKWHPVLGDADLNLTGEMLVSALRSQEKLSNSISKYNSENS